MHHTMADTLPASTAIKNDDSNSSSDGISEQQDPQLDVTHDMSKDTSDGLQEAASTGEETSASVPPSLPTSSLTFGSNLGYMYAGTEHLLEASVEGKEEEEEEEGGDDDDEAGGGDGFVGVASPETKRPLDIFENVTKSIEEVKQKMSAKASSLEKGSPAGPRRGSDFLLQVKKDFSEASQDISRATHDVVSSASARLRPQDLSTEARASGTTVASPAAAKRSTTPITSTIPKPRLKIFRESTQEHAHSFYEHSYKAPTYCQICNGLLVGLWSQGFRCKICHMNVHRGEGIGDHHDCKGEAILTPCPGPDAEKDQRREEESAKLGDVIAQIRELANNPNFIKEVTDQLDKDVKARAKDVIVEAAVDDERDKNLRRLKAALVPLVHKMDAVAANGELYVLMVLLGLQALAAIAQKIISLGLFTLVLAPRHGLMTRSAFQLAAMHDSTVTSALHTVLFVVSALLFYLTSLFKRKAAIVDRFFRDALRMDAETDIGISVADAAVRAKFWSKRIYISSLIAVTTSFVIWHFYQPTSWEEAALPPVSKIFVPALAFTLSSGAVAYISYTKVPAEVLMDDYVDVKEEMIKDEIEIASKLVESGVTESLEAPEGGCVHPKDEEDKEDSATRLHNVLDDLVPDGAIMD